jgi:TonB family protein
MMIKLYTIFSLFLLCLTGKSQSYIVLHGDTINQIDSFGRRQGVWSLTNNFGVKVEMRFKNDLLKDTIRYYEKSSPRLTYVRSGFDTIFYTYTDVKVSCNNFVTDTINYCSDQPTVRAQIKRLIMYEMHPAFYGGDTAMRSYLKNKIKDFPKDQKGKVLVSFNVDEAGRLSAIKIKSSDNPALDEYCLKAVKDMPRWQPAYQSGSLVKTSMEVPIVCKDPNPKATVAHR